MLNITERKCNTTLVLVPPAVTSKVQPLDGMINSEFKKSVDLQATEMLAKDPELFVTGKLVRGAFFSFHKMDRASLARSLPSIEDTIIVFARLSNVVLPFQRLGNEITKLTLVG